MELKLYQQLIINNLPTAEKNNTAMTKSPIHTLTNPPKSLADFVYCFSSLQDLAAMGEGVIIPNGKIDVSFSTSTNNQFSISLMGLETKPKHISKQAISRYFSISFNPLAVEYIFQHSIADILNKEKALPADFWGFSAADLNNFDLFCKKASQKIQSLLPVTIDERKLQLFALIFAANGEISIKDLSQKLFWSARQINQYFNQQFGLSLKAYCNILRFQASLPHIKAGKLFPQLNFYDQSHFIKEIKKLSGASPKELFKNENNRFLQFSVTDKK